MGLLQAILDLVPGENLFDKAKVIGGVITALAGVYGIYRWLRGTDDGTRIKKTAAEVAEIRRFLEREKLAAKQWQELKESTDLEKLRSFMNEFSDTKYAPLARAQMEKTEKNNARLALAVASVPTLLLPGWMVATGLTWLWNKIKEP